MKTDIVCEIRGYIDLLENSGWEALADWDRLRPEYREILTRAYADPNQLFAELAAGYATEYDTQIDENGMEFISYGGEKLDAIERNLHFSHKNLHLTGLNIKDMHQRQGIGTQILKGAYAVAKKLGFQSLTSNAGGGAAVLYARHGFEVDEPEFHADKIKREAEQSMEENGVPDEAREEIRDMLESLENGHGDYIQDIVAHDYGKQALTHVSYNAVLKFNDARSMKLFNNPL